MNTDKRVRVGFYLLLVIASLLLPFVPAAAQDVDDSGDGGAAGEILVLNATGEVTPAFQSYVERGIDAAQDELATALIIRLDTPGGSVDITKHITQRMTSATVPIVVYVAPSGAHAASAGTFLTLAGHVAAMAPGTSVGAASPVGLGGEALTDTMKSKVTNILTADIEGLARRRGEKAVEWARQAVTEARAATEEEALRLGVIDYVAPDLPTLLRAMDGREVVVAGSTVVLKTAAAPVREIEMTPIEYFLHVITSPNIAFILMTIGINGLLFELASPGGYVSGVIGAICLVLALYAFGALPVNYTGFLFIAMAFVLFVFDIKAPTHGVLTVAGVASFVFGSFVLFNSPLYAISRSLIFTVAGATGLFFAFVVTKAVSAQRWPVVTGSEGLIGQMAEARSDLMPEGMVFVKGELWTAVARGKPMHRGEWVRVIDRRGFRLMVEPWEGEAPPGKR